MTMKQLRVQTFNSGIQNYNRIHSMFEEKNLMNYENSIKNFSINNTNYIIINTPKNEGTHAK